ncbi:Glycine--tRNA ligase beta subunit [Buchnera aphidicola (Eriosoma grossulariae)]|uniref:glycine--tRNA ligase subunit beta n=1 Tax=Buchnera aphidicola TaxID=9 RepID=UPI0034649132
MKNNTFLVELGVEELPAKKLYNIGLSFYQNIKSEIKNNNIKYSTIKWFATPRRLAVKIHDIHIQTSQKQIIIKGPLIQNTFDETDKTNNHTIFWMKKIGITLKDTFILHNKNKKWIAYKKNIQKKININIFAKIIESSIKKISIGKLMQWNQSKKKFFRPIRTITLMYNDIIIPLITFDISSNCLIRGHQILGNNYIHLNHADEYPIKLFQEGNVIACYEKRKEFIKNQCMLTAKNINGNILINNELLDEITSLVEWPVIHLAQFEKNFLKLPEIAIINTIQHDQKCFPIYNQKILTTYFIIISNIESNDTKNIINGYEKVINSRLSDAQFFFNQDRKNKLEDLFTLLKNIIFQKNLGNLFDKTKRLQKLSKYIAKKTNANTKDVYLAATLSKCDLISNMVIAFPNIQGTIGMHYALMDGVKQDIAIAIQDQYKPDFSGDILPKNNIGDILSIADKIDLITGMFSIDQIPSSNKDPFALRRSAIGILRIIIEKKISINLEQLTEKSLELYQLNIKKDHKKKEILKFIMNRLYDLYQKKGYNHYCIQSALTKKNTNLIKIDLRIKALEYFITLKDAQSVILAIKRITNILKKFNCLQYNEINISLLESFDEKILFDSIQKIEKQSKNLYKTYQYQTIIINIIQLNTPIHNFFNSTIINHNNDMIKINRLNLLKKVEKIFLNIGDFSILEIKE